MTSEEIIQERSDGRCEIPNCTLKDFRGLQYAHLSHKKMGGRGSSAARIINDPRNLSYLCAVHHDILDGRNYQPNLREELMSYLKEKLNWDSWYNEARQGGINV